MKNNFFTKIFSVLVCLFFSFPAMAESSQIFVRVTCLPEENFLKIEYVGMDKVQVLLDGEKNLDKARVHMDDWKKSGYYEIKSLDLQCKMAGALFELKTNRLPEKEKGECAASPDILITLSRNKKEILNHAVFGESCLEKPSILSVEIHEEFPGWFKSSLNFCYLKNGVVPSKDGSSNGGQEICKDTPLEDVFG